MNTSSRTGYTRRLLKNYRLITVKSSSSWFFLFFLPPERKFIEPPMYQSHCQLLSKVPSKMLIEIWMDVCQKAPNGTITTAFLENYLDENNLRTTQKSGSRNSSSSSLSSSNLFKASSSESLISGSNSKRSLNNHEANETFVSNGQSSTDTSFSQEDNNSKHADDAFNPHQSQLQLPEPDMTVNQTASDSTFTSTDPPFTHQHPIHEPTIFHLSKSVVSGGVFDIVLQTPQDYMAWDSQPWFGRLWCNLTAIRPLTTSHTYSVPPPANPQSPLYEGGLEHLLRIIFTKFAGNCSCAFLFQHVLILVRFF